MAIQPTTPNDQADALNGRLLPTPRYWATSASTLGTTSECVLLMYASAAVMGADGQPTAANLPVVQVSMPPVVVKEMLLILQDYVTEVEKVVGPLKSAFIEERSKA